MLKKKKKKSNIVSLFVISQSFHSLTTRNNHQRLVMFVSKIISRLRLRISTLFFNILFYLTISCRKSSQYFCDSRLTSLIMHWECFQSFILFVVIKVFVSHKNKNKKGKILFQQTSKTNQMCTPQILNTLVLLTTLFDVYLAG